MPGGTLPIKFISGGGSVSCPNAERLVAPLAKAEAAYAQRLGPHTTGPPVNGVRDLYEVISVYAHHTAVQRVQDYQTALKCPDVGYRPLSVPRIASDQVSFRLTPSSGEGDDFIVVPVNDSTVLSVVSQDPSANPDTSLVALARMAYSRAKNKLGG
jgi:hypothetical protein